MSSSDNNTNARAVEKLTRAIVEWYYAKCGSEQKNREYNPLEHQTRVVTLLEQDPTLAAAKIGDETSFDTKSFYALEYNDAYPLMYLIDFECNLDVIQKVYNMWPDAVRHKQTMEQPAAYPVFFACQKRPLPTSTIVFLAHAYPEAVQEPKRAILQPDKLALFEALIPKREGQFASFELIQSLVHCYPDSARYRWQGKLLLEELIQHGYMADSKIIDFAVSKLDPTVNTLTVAGNKCCGAPATVRTMQRVLQAVLLQLQNLLLVPNCDTADGFARLLRVVASQPWQALTRLTLAVPSLATYDKNASLRHVLCQVLSMQPNLQEVSIRPAKARNQQNKCRDAVLQDVMTSMATRFRNGIPALQSMQLEHVQISTASHLAALFTCPYMTHRLALHHLTMDTLEWNEGTLLTGQPLSNSSLPIQNIEFKHCDLASSNCLGSMLCDLANALPFLQTLHVQDPSFMCNNSEAEPVEDLTRLILALITTCEQLKDLRLVNTSYRTCFEVDMSAVCRALADNTTLQTLHLTVNLGNDPDGCAQLLQLVKKNCTLQDVVVYAQGECFTKTGFSVDDGSANQMFRFALSVVDKDYVAALQYYLNLNRFGRAQVQSNNISKEQFVDLLDCANVSLADHKSGLALLNVTYGLLREAPYLLSTRSSSSSSPQEDGEARRVRRRLM